MSGPNSTSRAAGGAGTASTAMAGSTSRTAALAAARAEVDPAAALLTISQLAAYVGVTVRAVRHYHQRGLLAEPERDASGYRRYGTRAVLDLIRIKVLGEAGVPLARVEELLGAAPADLAASVTAIDADLQRQIEELQRRREHLAGLVGGDRLFVPEPLADYLDELRAVGIGEDAVRLERDGWILIFARYPRQALDWVARKRRDLADPAYRRLYRGYDEASGWAPDDPRLAELAEAMVRYAAEHYAADELTLAQDLDDPTVLALLGSYFGSISSPALERLYELVEEVRRASPAGPPPGP